MFMFKPAALTAVVVAGAMASQAGATDPTTLLDPAHQGAGSHGSVFRPVDENGSPAFFTMSASSSLNPAQPFNPTASGLAGVIWIENNGAGVKTASVGGSGGISGGGPHQNEQITFSFDAPVLAAQIILGLNNIKFGNGAGHDDDPVLFFSAAGSGLFAFTIQEDAIKAAFTSTGNERGLVNFGLLAGLPQGLMIDAFVIRETRDHIFVNLLTNPVPGPGAAAMLALSAMLAAGRRRR